MFFWDLKSKTKKHQTDRNKSDDIVPSANDSFFISSRAFFGKTYPEDLVFSCTEAQVGAPLRTAMQQVHLGCAWGDGEARCYVLVSLVAGCNSFFASIGLVFTIIGIICSLLLILDLKSAKQNADLIKHSCVRRPCFKV